MTKKRRIERDKNQDVLLNDMTKKRIESKENQDDFINDMTKKGIKKSNENPDNPIKEVLDDCENQELIETTSKIKDSEEVKKIPGKQKKRKNGKTKFQERWLGIVDCNGDQVKDWVYICGKYQFQCSWCKGKVLNVARGGDCQVKQHAKTTKLKGAKKKIEPATSITNPTVLRLATLNDVVQKTKDNPTSIPPRLLTLGEKNLKGETIIGLSQTENGISFRAMANVISDFKDIDQEPKIWNEIQMGKTKINYVTTFGIGKHQENRIKKNQKKRKVIICILIHLLSIRNPIKLELQPKISTSLSDILVNLAKR